MEFIDFRKERGLSRLDIAKATKLDVKYIKAIDDGFINIHLVDQETKTKICLALNTSIDELNKLIFSVRAKDIIGLESEVENFNFDLNDILIFTLNKYEVSNGIFHRLDHIMDILNRQGKNAFQILGLSFEYDDDPREIWDIPEVVRYIKQILEKYPYFFYFYFDISTKAVSAFLYCLSGARTVQTRADMGKVQLAVDTYKVLDLAKKYILGEIEEYGRKNDDYIRSKRFAMEVYGRVLSRLQPK